MRIFYPYNENLPKKSAHDTYVVRNCAGLAGAGADVTLAIGACSIANNILANHYQIPACSNLHFKRLPIIRRNWGLPFNINPVFFWFTQQVIKEVVPDWVILSVLKQGAFHLHRKEPGVKYAYEVHELGWYPGADLSDKSLRARVDIEKIIFSQADILTVTTHALKGILQDHPYSILTPIEVVPLAVDFSPLPLTSSFDDVLELMYVGQLYDGQGVELAIEALAQTSGIRLTLVGGTPAEVKRLQQLSRSLGIEERVKLVGFVPPAKLGEVVSGAHAFVAPFSAAGRMPYVAHTKLLEYSAWQRPVIAPDLAVTREHFTAHQGWIPFIADDKHSLACAMQSLVSAEELKRQSTACQQFHTMSWAQRSSLQLGLLG